MDSHAIPVAPHGKVERRPVAAPSTPALCLHSACGLTFQPQRCSRIGSRYDGCDACTRACPAGVIRVDDDSMAVGAGCLGCGRCQAACPGGALRLAAFELDLRAPTRRGVAELDCARVAPALRAGHALPCLGGLSVGAILDRCLAVHPRPLVLLDRGWCGDCPAGGTTHPARHQLEQAAAFLSEAGVPQAQLPRMESRPLATMPMPMESAAAGTGASRRRFLRAFTGEAISAVRGDASSAARPRARGEHLPSTERDRVLRALSQFVARCGGRLPRALFHRLEVGPECSGHRVCAAGCPTGALRRYRDPVAGDAGIAFDSMLCTGCGRCAAICPERALSVVRGTGAASAAHRPLTHFALRSCERCGGEFACKPSANTLLCDRCIKSRRLAQAGFQQLFGARPMSRETREEEER